MPKRMKTFGFVIISAVTVVLGYVFTSLVYNSRLTGLQTVGLGVGIVSLGGLLLAMPLYFWSHPHRGETLFQLRLQVFMNHAQGYFSFLLFGVVLRDLISLIGFEFRSPEATLFLVIGPVIFSFVGRFPILLGPSVKKVLIQNNKVAPEWENLKMAQISDLHIGPGLRKEYVERVVQIVNQLKPDLIFLTGDIVDHLDRWFESEIAILGGLQSTKGNYFISGNHEFYWKYEPIAEKFRKMGFHVLENSHQAVESQGGHPLYICGVRDYAAEYFGLEGPNLAKSLQGVPDSAFKILLAHQPKIADEAAKAGFDLQFSGHTHAGQFVPWSWMIGLFQKYSKGLYQIQTMSLYVNQGTGYWGPPNRLGTWPEVTLATLQQKKI